MLGHAGSMARTAGDLVLLDSIVRNSVAKTTGNGAVASALSCTVNVNSSMSLKGVRLGLPSTEGWVPSATYDGISGEVGPSWPSTILYNDNSIKLTLRYKKCTSPSSIRQSENETKFECMLLHRLLSTSTVLITLSAYQTAAAGKVESMQSCLSISVHVL